MNVNTHRKIQGICEKWQERLKVEPTRIQIKKMENKWSSCSSKGNVTFNSEIVLLPKEIAEYVILHELLHLVVPNHGKTYKVLLSIYLPNWERLHFRLNSYGFLASANPNAKKSTGPSASSLKTDLRKLRVYKC